MNEITFSDGNIFSRTDISKTPNSIKVPTSKIQKDAACLPNAVEIARHNSEVEIIEGLVIVIPKNNATQKGGIIKHAWNKLNDVQFDVTEEIIWTEEYKRLLYFPIIGKNKSEYGKGLVDFDKVIYGYKSELELELEQAIEAKKSIEDSEGKKKK